jgi:hypothetical protein
MTRWTRIEARVETMSKLTSLIPAASAGRRRAFFLSLLAAILCVMPGRAPAQSLYVGNADTIGLFDAASGTAINSSFVTGLSHPDGLLLSGNTLFVANFDTNIIGTYDATTGAPINASFITGLNGPMGLALSGNTLYVGSFIDSSVSTYDATTGQLINANFIAAPAMPGGACSLLVAGSNLYVAYQTTATVMAYDATTGAVKPGFSTITGQSAPFVRGLALLDDHLFVANLSSDGSVSEYDAATGTVINASFVSGLSFPGALAVSDNHLFVTHSGTVSKFDATTGASVSSDFITGFGTPVSLAAAPVAVPEPASGLLLTLGCAFLNCRRRRI